MLTISTSLGFPAARRQDQSAPVGKSRYQYGLQHVNILEAVHRYHGDGRLMLVFLIVAHHPVIGTFCLGFSQPRARRIFSLSLWMVLIRWRCRGMIRCTLTRRIPTAVLFFRKVRWSAVELLQEHWFAGTSGSYCILLSTFSAQIFVHNELGGGLCNVY